MPRLKSTAHIATPRTGVELHALRVLSLGVSARDVSARLGVSVHTLQSWERSWAPCPTDRSAAWRKALAEAATDRRERLHREGLDASALEGSDFARALAALSDAEGAR